MTASHCQADSGSAISHSEAKHLFCAVVYRTLLGQAPVTAVTERRDMPICPPFSDFRTCLADMSLRGGHKHPVVVARRHTIRTRPGLSEQRRLSVSSGLVENAFSLLNGGVRVPLAPPYKCRSRALNGPDAKATSRST